MPFSANCLRAGMVGGILSAILLASGGTLFHSWMLSRTVLQFAIQINGKPIYDPVKREVEIQYGKRNDLGVIHLVRGMGAVEITSKPGKADFSLRENGVAVHEGETPTTLRDLPAGEYDVLVHYEGLEQPRHRP